jgi:hypothetical protein
MVGYQDWCIIYMNAEFALLPKGRAQIEDECG